MNKEKMFITFLESLRDEKNTHMIDAITEGFALTEGFRLPDIKNGAADAIDAFKGRMGGKSAEKLSDAQVAERKDKFAREEKSAKQQDWRVSGSMASVVKFAKTQPMAAEKWMEETLKPAIKAGKMEMDQKFGTDSAKRGILDRVKSAAKSFTESSDGASDETLYKALQDHIADFNGHIKHNGVDTALTSLIQGYCAFKKYDTELSALSDIAPAVFKSPEMQELVKRVTAAKDKINNLYDTRDFGERKRVMMNSVVIPLCKIVDSVYNEIQNKKQSGSSDFDF
jgi:rubrerythrin